ncbi:MAG TPA: hypothetical protein PK413_12815, partial [Thermoanaerobaculia bacterium]|nr:hypothetical protein [Thermoanaerobaculia bacterium]
LDLDLVLEAKIQQRLVAFLESRGYRTLHCSSGYSNHLHDDPLLGRLDFVFVDPETAEKLFAATRWLKGPHERPIPVAAPEHLVAMKVMALKNDPSRSELERADLRFLLRQPGVDLDYARSLFARHGLEATYDELREAT